MGLFYNETECLHCGSKDHSSDDCPHDRSIFYTDTECSHCGSKEHASEDCPHDRSIFYADTQCIHCGSKDHSSDDCKHERSFFYSENECMHCQSKEHSSDDCPHYRSIFYSETACTNCGSKNHASENCVHEDHPNRIKIECTYCDSTQHASENCTHRKTERSIPTPKLSPFAMPSLTSTDSSDLPDSSSDAGTKIIAWIIAICAIVFVVVWLAVNVVFPVLLLNSALLLTLYAIIKKERRTMLAIFALVGGAYLFFDISNGGLSGNFVNNVVKENGWITAFVFINALALGLSTWFLVEPLWTKANRLTAAEKQKRSLLIGATVLLLLIGTSAIPFLYYTVQNPFSGGSAFISTNYVPQNQQINTLTPVQDVQQTVATGPDTLAADITVVKDTSARYAVTELGNGVSKFTGESFEINFPSSFIANPDLIPNSEMGALSSIFTSPNSDISFYIFYTQFGASPPNIAFDPDLEEVTSDITRSYKGQNIRHYTYQAIDKSYWRSYQETTKTGNTQCWIIGLRYKNQEIYEQYKPVYLKFKKSFKWF